jgi:hypothetical protein
MKLEGEPQSRPVTVWDRCRTPGCQQALFSLREAENGQCSTCWVAGLSKEKKSALNRLVASAFNGSTDEQKGKAVDDAMDALDLKRKT